MVRGSGFLVIIVVKMIVSDFHPLECPQSLSTVVVELLADKDMIQRLSCIVEYMSVVHIPQASVFLKGADCVQINVASALGKTRQYEVWLSGKNVERVAVLTVVEVAQNHDWRIGIFHFFGQDEPQSCCLGGPPYR